MPRGYVFHNNLYKTIPDSEPGSIGIPYTLPDMARSAASWRAAARDLTARMIANGALNGGPVFIAPQSPEGPFPAAFDHALREALLEGGFALASAPGQGPVLTYKIEKACDRKETTPQQMTTVASSEQDPASVETETAPVSSGPPMPLDVPPESTRPAPPSVSSVPTSHPKLPAPVKDGLKLTIMTIASEEKNRNPQILALESGVYTIPGADIYDWRKPLIDWRPVTWGLR